LQEKTEFNIPTHEYSTEKSDFKIGITTFTYNFIPYFSMTLLAGDGNCQITVTKPVLS